MVHGLSVDDRVGAARVVSHSAADRRPTRRARVWREHQAVRAQLPVELRQRDSRLRADPAFFWIHLDHVVHVLGVVDDDRTFLHRLAGQPGAAAAAQNLDAVPVADLDNGLNVLNGLWQHHSRRLHLVNAGVLAVEGTRVTVEPDFALDNSGEFAGEIGPRAGRHRVQVPPSYPLELFTEVGPRAQALKLVGRPG